MRCSFPFEHVGSGFRSSPIDDPSQWTVAAWLQVAAVAALVITLHIPLGNYMASVYADTRHWRVEKVVYRLIGAQPDETRHVGAGILRPSACSSCTGCCWCRRDCRSRGDTAV